MPEKMTAFEIQTEIDKLNLERAVPAKKMDDIRAEAMERKLNKKEEQKLRSLQKEMDGITKKIDKLTKELISA